ASFEGQPIEIFTTRPEGPESTPIGAKASDLYSVSPSGELAVSLRERFQAGPSGPGTLATMPLGGGAPREIAEFVEHADWMPDGKQLAIVRFGEGRYRLEMPPGKTIYTTERDMRRMRVSPRGDRFALFVRDAVGENSLIVVDLAGKATTLIPGGIRGQ